MSIHMGTCSWKYDSWQGIVYSKEVKGNYLAEYARHFAGVRLGRGHGPPRILTDLLSHGVERRLAERAIEEVVDREGFDPMEQARLLVEKRLAQLGDLPRERLQRRLLAFLVRRGYRGWEVRDLVEAAAREVSSSERGAG